MDMDGNIVKRYRFDSFGNLEAQWGTEPSHYLFTGKEKDRSGFYYFGARYYNPRLGRFVTPDPEPRVPGERLLENPQLLNPYAYCQNNPLRYIDPDGRRVRPLSTFMKYSAFREAMVSIPLYYELHRIPEYKYVIYITEKPFRWGKFEPILILKYESGKTVITKGRIRICPEVFKYGKDVTEAVLFKEMLHAAFAYSTGARYYALGKEGWKWIIAEDVVAGEKMLEYIKRRKLQIPEEILKQWKRYIESLRKKTKEEYIKTIQKEMEEIWH